LAGECLSSESRQLQEHLDNCQECRAELAELRQLDFFLDLWSPDPSPPDLMEGVFQALRQEPRTVEPVLNRWFRPSLFRDLIFAAAVSLAVFWVGFSWQAVSHVNQAGKNINHMTTVYSRVVGDNLERSQEVVQKYSSKILIEEWKYSDMY